MTSDQLTELEALLAKATGLPWGVERTDRDNWVGPMRASGEKVSAIVFSSERDKTYMQETIDQRDADAELIVAAVNALPGLIKELREARASEDRLGRRSETMNPTLAQLAERTSGE